MRLKFHSALIFAALSVADCVVALSLSGWLLQPELAELLGQLGAMDPLADISNVGTPFEQRLQEELLAQTENSSHASVGDADDDDDNDSEDDDDSPESNTDYENNDSDQVPNHDQDEAPQPTVIKQGPPTPTTPPLPLTKMQQLAIDAYQQKTQMLAGQKFDSEKVGMYSHNVKDSPGNHGDDDNDGGLNCMTETGTLTLHVCAQTRSGNSKTTPMVAGGHSQMRRVEADERDLFIGLKSQVEAMGDVSFTEFEPIACTSQVVAGTNFWVKARTDTGFVHFKVFRPLPHTGQPSKVQVVHTGQTKDAPFDTRAV